MIRIMVVEDRDPEEVIISNVKVFLPGVEMHQLEIVRTMEDGVTAILAMPTRNGLRNDKYFDIVFLDMKLHATRDTSMTRSGPLDELYRMVQTAGVDAESVEFQPEYEDGGKWLWSLIQRRMRFNTIKPLVVLFSNQEQFAKELQPFRFAEIFEFFMKETKADASRTSDVVSLATITDKLSNLRDDVNVRAKEFNEILQLLRAHYVIPTPGDPVPIKAITNAESFYARLDSYRSPLLVGISQSNLKAINSAVNEAKDHFTEDRLAFFKNLGSMIVTVSGASYALAQVFPDVNFNVNSLEEANTQLARLSQGLKGRPQAVILSDLFTTTVFRDVAHFNEATLEAAHAEGTLKSTFDEALAVLDKSEGIFEETRQLIKDRLDELSRNLASSPGRRKLEAAIESFWESIRCSSLSYGPNTIELPSEQYLDVTRTQECLDQALRVMNDYALKIVGSTASAVLLEQFPGVKFSIDANSQQLEDQGWMLDGFVKVITSKVADPRLHPHGGVEIAAGAQLFNVAKLARGYFDVFLELRIGGKSEALELVTLNETLRTADRDGITLTLRLKLWD